MWHVFPSSENLEQTAGASIRNLAFLIHKLPPITILGNSGPLVSEILGNRITVQGVAVFETVLLADLHDPSYVRLALGRR